MYDKDRGPIDDVNALTACDGYGVSSVFISLKHWTNPTTRDGPGEFECVLTYHMLGSISHLGSLMENLEHDPIQLQIIFTHCSRQIVT